MKPAKPIPTPLEDGTEAWTPMCSLTHPCPEGSYLWMGATSTDRDTALLNARLHNESAHPPEQEALW